MSRASSLDEFQELASALKKAGSDFHASQVHGLICGLICTTPKKFDNQIWKKRILGKKNKVAENLLHQLLETTYHELTEFSLEFSLLLPDDETDINDRTEALGLWCQGFLTGFGQVENREKNDVGDAIHDLIEIANVSYGQIPGNEEDEHAYIELAEYIRLAVLMIFQETRTDGSKKNRDVKNYFH